MYVCVCVHLYTYAYTSAAAIYVLILIYIYFVALGSCAMLRRHPAPMSGSFKYVYM